MLETESESLSTLQAKIAQQQSTVAALRRDGHECADAERQLALMLADLEHAKKAAAGTLSSR